LLKNKNHPTAMSRAAGDNQNLAGDNQILPKNKNHPTATNRPAGDSQNLASDNQTSPEHPNRAGKHPTIFSSHRREYQSPQTAPTDGANQPSTTT
jgi:hypothetical protein